MKKSIYISGLACAILVMAGSLFKALHFPGAHILLMIAILSFCFYFLPFGLIQAYKSSPNQQKKGLYMVTFVTFFIGMLSVLFKILNWPGSQLLITLAIPIPFIFFLPAYLYFTKGSGDKGTLNFLGILFGLTFLAVFSVLLSLRVGKNIIQAAGFNLYTNTAKTVLYEKQISGKPQLPSAESLCSYIKELRNELNLQSNNTGFVPAPGNMPDHFDNVSIGQEVLYYEVEKPRIALLKEKVKAFKNEVSNKCNANKPLIKLTNELFDLSTVVEENESTWENRTFPSFELVFVLNALAELESNVRLVELEAAKVNG